MNLLQNNRFVICSVLTIAASFIVFLLYATKYYRNAYEIDFSPPCHPLDPQESYAIAKAINASIKDLNDIEEVLRNGSVDVDYGKCHMHIKSRKTSKIIIILPYRERQFDLLVFLLHMLSYANNQNLDMEILVAEQTAGKPFNRAKLFNAAVREIDLVAKAGDGGRLGRSSCFAFHDVDKLPATPDVPYHCESGPHQLLRSCTYRQGMLSTYPTFLGGVTMFSREQLEKINGFSNAFYGWGGEDDDLWNRVQAAGMKVVRAPLRQGLFYEENGNHTRDINPDRVDLLQRQRNPALMYSDGLKQVNYTLLKRHAYFHFVWMLFDI